MSELEILYHDQYLIAIDKPHGMLVHPGRTPEPREHIAMKVVRDMLNQKIHTVHRLDRPTSGVLLFALDPDSERIIKTAFENKEMEKRYFAVVRGKVEEQWQCNDALRKAPDAKLKESRTDFRRLAYLPAGTLEAMPELDISVVEARPQTGRHHQIRKHLHAAGHAIVGDYLYGDIDDNNELAEKLGIKRMMLKAKELTFHHPIIGKDICITAPTSCDFKYFLNLAKS
ncbi:MAG: pseudouridylate synthase [Lentisphaeraceae bacterium]|nr:pseudouridylate synthase [Lentisphaeraceae bacterium]